MSRARTFLCRCRDVTLEEFREAFGEGLTELESLSHFTGLGTGFCQGKGCLGDAAAELAALRDEAFGRPETSDIRPTDIRPPARPLTFGQLAHLDVPDPPPEPDTEDPA